MIAITNFVFRVEPNAVIIGIKELSIQQTTYTV